MDNIVEGVKAHAVRLMLYILIAVCATLVYSWLSIARVTNEKKKLARQMKIERQKIYKKSKIKKRKARLPTIGDLDENKKSKQKMQE